MKAWSRAKSLIMLFIWWWQNYHCVRLMVCTEQERTALWIVHHPNMRTGYGYCIFWYLPFGYENLDHAYSGWSNKLKGKDQLHAQIVCNESDWSVCCHSNSVWWRKNWSMCLPLKTRPSEQLTQLTLHLIPNWHILPEVEWVYECIDWSMIFESDWKSEIIFTHLDIAVLPIYLIYTYKSVLYVPHSWKKSSYNIPFDPNLNFSLL